MRESSCSCSKILIVGGRIVNANILYGKKHPILVPGEHYA